MKLSFTSFAIAIAVAATTFSTAQVAAGQTETTPSAYFSSYENYYYFNNAVPVSVEDVAADSESSSFVFAICGSVHEGCLGLPPSFDQYGDGKRGSIFQQAQLGPFEEIGTPTQQWTYTADGLLKTRSSMSSTNPNDNDDTFERCLGTIVEDLPAVTQAETEDSLNLKREKPTTSAVDDDDEDSMTYRLISQPCPLPTESIESTQHLRWLIDPNSSGQVQSLAPLRPGVAGDDHTKYCLTIQSWTETATVEEANNNNNNNMVPLPMMDANRPPLVVLRPCVDVPTEENVDQDEYASAMATAQQWKPYGNAPKMLMNVVKQVDGNVNDQGVVDIAYSMGYSNVGQYALDRPDESTATAAVPAYTIGLSEDRASPIAHTFVVTDTAGMITITKELLVSIGFLDDNNDDMSDVSFYVSMLDFHHEDDEYGIVVDLSARMSSSSSGHGCGGMSMSKLWSSGDTTKTVVLVVCIVGFVILGLVGVIGYKLRLEHQQQRNSNDADLEDTAKVVDVDDDDMNSDMDMTDHSSVGSESNNTTDDDSDDNIEMEETA